MFPFARSPRRSRSESVLLGKQDGRHRAIGLGDDPYTSAVPQLTAVSGHAAGGPSLTCDRALSDRLRGLRQLGAGGERELIAPEGDAVEALQVGRHLESTIPHQSAMTAELAYRSRFAARSCRQPERSGMGDVGVAARPVGASIRAVHSLAVFRVVAALEECGALPSVLSAAASIGRSAGAVRSNRSPG